MSSLHKSKPSTSNSKSSTCSYYSTFGALDKDNEFLQFYSDLYKSAVLYSDYDFQQRILYPCIEPSQPPLVLYKEPKLHSSHSSSKARGHGHGGSKKDVPPITAIATSSVRRKVSFSKHSPKLNIITPTPPSSSLSIAGPTGRRALPKITVEEQTSSCWSSDLEESDTTETERATSDKDSDTSDFKQVRVKLMGRKPSPVQLVGMNDSAPSSDVNSGFEKRSSPIEEAGLGVTDLEKQVSVDVDNLNNQSFA